MNKFLKAALCIILAAALGCFASCEDNKQVDEADWTKAFENTLSAKNFTVKATLTYDGDTVVYTSKGDRDGGKFWAKYEAGEENGESYWVKGNLGTTAYSKEGNGEWTVASEDEDFDELFDEWITLGDGIRPTFEQIKGLYSSATFNEGVYTLDIKKTSEMPAYTAKVVISKEHVKSLSLDSEDVKAIIEFSDYGSTKLPAVPTVKTDSTDSTDSTESTESSGSSSSETSEENSTITPPDSESSSEPPLDSADEQE